MTTSSNFRETSKFERMRRYAEGTEKTMVSKRCDAARNDFECLVTATELLQALQLGLVSYENGELLISHEIMQATIGTAIKKSDGTLIEMLPMTSVTEVKLNVKFNFLNATRSFPYELSSQTKYGCMTGPKRIGIKEGKPVDRTSPQTHDDGSGSKLVHTRILE